MLQKLYRYIAGNYVDNTKIDMTLPIVILDRHSKDGFKSAENNRVIAFYLLQQFQVSLFNTFEDGIFSFAIYDPPTTLWNRHNEIWVGKPES